MLAGALNCLLDCGQTEVGPVIEQAGAEGRESLLVRRVDCGAAAEGEADGDDLAGVILREIGEHAGRRVCARRNRTCARRKARRSISQAGNRHWSFKGATRRCEIEAAEERIKENPKAGRS